MATHFTRSAGCSYCNLHNIARVEYGVLRSVYASTACNYSYREFWF